MSKKHPKNFECSYFILYFNIDPFSGFKSKAHHDKSRELIRKYSDPNSRKSKMKSVYEYICHDRSYNRDAHNRCHQCVFYVATRSQTTAVDDLRDLKDDYDRDKSCDEYAVFDDFRLSVCVEEEFENVFSEHKQYYRKTD